MEAVTVGIKRRTSGKNSKDRQHYHHAEKYRRQLIRTRKNKERAWTRHLAKHPLDVKAKENIKRVRAA